MKSMKDMRAQGWEPGYAGLRDRREVVSERTASRTFGVFVHDFPSIVPAANGGAQPCALVAPLMTLMSFMVSNLA